MRGFSRAFVLGAAIGIFAGAAAGQEWIVEEIDVGTKPALAVDGQGQPHITYMTEALQGSVSYGVRGADGWAIETVATGYFYAPMDLALDAEDQPHIYYHDHQSTQFQPDLGEAVYAFKQLGAWTTETLFDPGHDGWDGSLAIGSDGTVHLVAIDPAQFGGVTGVEYYHRVDGQWTIVEIGSGPTEYEFGTDIALDSQGRPHVVYHSGTANLNASGADSDLMYAVLGDAGWEIETVVSSGDVGKFASLALDSQDRPHISYFDWQTRTSGRVMYAHFENGGFTLERVGGVDDMDISFLGARKTTSLALDAEGQPRVAFSDRSGLFYATRKGSEWVTETVARPTQDGMALGQFTSLSLAPSGQPHIAFYELPGSPRNSTGTVYYATLPLPPSTAVAEEGAGEGQTPPAFELSQNFPNPFNAGTSIPFVLPREADVELAVYNLQGQLVRVLVHGSRPAGAHRVSWDGLDTEGGAVATGVYFMRLRVGDSAQLRKLLLLQ